MPRLSVFSNFCFLADSSVDDALAVPLQLRVDVLVVVDHDSANGAGEARLAARAAWRSARRGGSAGAARSPGPGCPGTTPLSSPRMKTELRMWSAITRKARAVLFVAVQVACRTAPRSRR